jgi:Rne/Rng family ribonuclease
MAKEMVISANPHETRVAIMEEGLLCEFYVERQKEFALVGSIYKGRVTRVLPGMQSAFVEIGLDSDAFLYVTDFLEGIEEFDPIVTTVEEKVKKMEEQGGEVFAPGGSTTPAVEPVDVESAPTLAPAAHAVEPLPGESFGQPASNASAPFISTPSHSSAPPRSQFQPRREGRDFGRRGGRRDARHGRRGGGGRDNRRFGRELPSSKYATPREHAELPVEPLPEGYVPIVLPGESLAKYRDKPPVDSSAAMPVAEAPLLETPSEQTHEAALQPIQAPSESGAAPADFHALPVLAELGPLPGESLSKYQMRPPLVDQHEDTAIAEESQADLVETIEGDQHHDDVHASLEIHVTELPLAEHVAEEEHPAPELSEEEAATLAEHVAEAQSEEAAREAQERSFAAADEIAAGSEAESAAAESAAPETEDEEQELEEEEADAEAEGMIAPHDESEHPDAIANEAEIAAAEDAALAPEHASENSGETQPQQPMQARVRNDFRSRMQNPARRGGRDRGRRDQRGGRPQHGHGGHSHGHGSRPQPRRPQLIADMLKQGQEIIVQIAKEPLGKKGARITSHVALPGRFLVYMPTLDHTGVSRKIASAEDRARLRHLVNDAKGTAGGGFIVRTAAGSAAPEEVRADVEFLTHTWAEIKARSEQRKAPSLLHRDLNLVERILRDYMSSDYTAIWVDSEEEYTKVVEFMGRFQPALVNRVKLYTKDTPVFEEFGIQQEIDKSLRPKVWLKSGGYIVINHTEALVAIDVNTGKFVGKGSNRLEDTIVKTNVEAVKEIVRQMRLRDLGGIIVIDFIDMEDRRNREKVMAALEDALRADRAPSKMLRFNEFGLIAITRKRTKQALERTLCQPCPYCTGSGMVKSVATLCYEIQTEARKMAPDMGAGSLTLRVHPEIAKALKTRESSLIDELEQWTKKSVIIQADPTLHWEQYDIY